jgi:hypothetical protein
MRTLALLSLLLLKFNFSIGQEFKMEVSYNYLYSNQWDKAIQTYNFSRPFNVEKQPLLIHGLNSSLSYIFKSTKNFNHGINASYSNFRSSAENENFNNILNLHFINLGYILHYENAEKWKGLYTDLIISAKSSGLFRNVNGEPFEYDNTRSKAFGIGGDLSIKAGYNVNLKNKIYLSLFFLVGYTPYIYSPNSEAVINQTKGLVSNNWSGIFTSQVGLAFHIKQ